MARAADVRDELVTELTTRFPDHTVEAFVIPHYTREELNADGPRIAVRCGGRELGLMQGPDETSVLIEVAVVGLAPKFDGVAPDYRTHLISAADGFDELMESVVALFMHEGDLERCGFADHWLADIEQVVYFEPEKLYNDGVWLSMIQLTYRDSED